MFKPAAGLVTVLLVLATSAAVAKGKPPAKPPAPAPSAAPAPAGKCRQPIKAACSGDKVAFAAAASTPFTPNAGDAPALAAADLNNDGKTDLLVSHTNGSIDILLSKGDGTFELTKNLKARVSGYGLGAVDLDGDCNADLIYSSFGTASVGNSVDVLMGKGGGKFGLPQNFDIAVDNCVQMQFVDINGDRRTDIAYAGNNGGVPAINLGTGKGGFTSPTKFDSKDPWTFGDVTGDGIADWVEVDSTYARKVPAVCVHANNGRGQFGDPVCFDLTANARPKFIRVADVNGDGKLDVVALTSENDTYANVLINLGGGKLDDREQYKTENCNAFAVTDLDGDGKGDIVCLWASQGGGLFVLRNKGDGTFGAKAEQYPLGSESSRSEEVLVVGDWLGNGLPGLATIARGADAVSVLAAECR